MANRSVVRFNSCASSPSFDTFLRVLDSDSSPVAECDDCGECGLRTDMYTLLDPGNYSLVVEGFEIASGTYSVDMECGSIDSLVVRQRLCRVFPPASWLRHRLCLVCPLPSQLRHRLCFAMRRRA